jgi:hypothetical protein
MIIAKSRILSTLRERLEAQGAQSLRFQRSPYYVNSAFWAVIDNFERALKFARDETAEAKLDKLEALIGAYYGRPRADGQMSGCLLRLKRLGLCNIKPFAAQEVERHGIFHDYLSHLGRRQCTLFSEQDRRPTRLGNGIDDACHCLRLAEDLWILERPCRSYGWWY